MAENLGSVYAEFRLSLEKLKGDIAHAKAQLRTAAAVIENMGQEAAAKAKKRMQNVSDTFTQVGAAMTGVGIGIAGALGAAVKTTASFESAMSRVKALSGASDEELKKLTETAKRLGATTAFSASQAAEGMQFLAMAGYNTNEIIAAMPGLLAAAAAGQTDLGRTADIVSNILSGFGLAASETARVADVLTKAFTSSNTSLEMLGETMKYVAPVANAVGLSLEEVTAAAGILGNAGIQASQAGTALRAILLRLADPPKEAAKALEQLGVRVTDSSGKMRPLKDILADLKKGMEGMGEAQKAAIASTIAGTEASAALLALLDAGPETLAKFTAELENAGGTAERIAEEQLNNLSGQLTILKSGIEGMALSIGESLLPFVKELTGFVQKLVDSFNNLPEPVKQSVAVFSALVAVLLLIGGPLLMLVGFLPNIAAGFTVASAAMAGLSATVAPLLPL
ncbi:MAG: phage tail tape measure protein, partial [Bacillota bacterium]